MTSISIENQSSYQNQKLREIQRNWKQITYLTQDRKTGIQVCHMRLSYGWIPILLPSKVPRCLGFSNISFHWLKTSMYCSGVLSGVQLASKDVNNGPIKPGANSPSS